MDMIDQLFLGLVIAAFAVFGVTVAAVTRYERSRPAQPVPHRRAAAPPMKRAA